VLAGLILLVWAFLPIFSGGGGILAVTAQRKTRVWHIIHLAEILRLRGPAFARKRKKGPGHFARMTNGRRSAVVECADGFVVLKLRSGHDISCPIGAAGVHVDEDGGLGISFLSQ